MRPVPIHAQPRIAQPRIARPRISVVLGGGWVLGGSFHAGVLLALEDSWGVDPRTVETIVGTSSGAVTAGLVAAGLSAEDLYARELGYELSLEGQALLGRTRTGKPTRDRVGVATALPADPTVALRAAAAYRPVAAGAVLAGLLPRGPRSHDKLRRYFDDLHEEGWPSTPRLRLCTVDLHSGRRVVVDDSSPATPGLAIAASCAVPGVHRPVRIAGNELIDGALHSVDNADATAESDIVIVSSPMSTDRRLGWLEPLAPVRNGIRASSRHEQEEVRKSSRLISVQPCAADISAMGADLNDRRRRRRVARQAYLTAVDIFNHHEPEAGIGFEMPGD